MKRHILIIILLTLGFASHADKATSLAMQEGNQAYEKGAYDQAIDFWQSLLTEGQECGELYYNLGNAYFRLEQYGPCLLNYERARRLMPRDRELRENLELAYSKTEDHIPEMPQLFFVRWWNHLVNSHSPHGWMNLCLLASLLVAACLSLFALAYDYQRRKWSLVGAIASGALLLFFAICTIAANQRLTTREDAIVMQPVTMAKSAPDSKSVDKFILHEGTKVHIEEQNDTWIKVRIGNGNSGWIANEDVEII